MMALDILAALLLTTHALHELVMAMTPRERWFTLALHRLLRDRHRLDSHPQLDAPFRVALFGLVSLSAAFRLLP